MVGSKLGIQVLRDLVGLLLVFVTVFLWVGNAVASPPVIPQFDKALSDQFKKDLNRADGMHPNAFAKVGDSNICTADTIYGLGCRNPVWGDWLSLAPCWRNYLRRVPPGAPPSHYHSCECEPSNSFTRESAAARPGAYTGLFSLPIADVPDFAWWTPDPACDPAESMIACEIRLIKPRYTFVNLGTNDPAFGLPAGEPAVQRILATVREIRSNRSAPILSTIPPNPSAQDWVSAMNSAIIVAAKRSQVPLMNVWKAMTGKRVVDSGVGGGIHYQTYPGPYDALQNSVIFTREALCYGNNLRNLIILRMLRRLDKAAVQTFTVQGSASAGKTQKQKGGKIKIKVKVRARENLNARGNGKIRVDKRSFILKPASKFVASGSRKILRLTPKKHQRAKEIATALEKRTKAKAKLIVKLTDEFSNKKTQLLSVNLKR